MVIVGVGADDRLDLPAAHHSEDVVDAVGRVDDDALVVVADHPDVVVHVERLAIQGEGAARDGMVDAHGAHVPRLEISASPPSAGPAVR